MSDEPKRQRGVIEMLCAEIGEPFDRRLECPEMLLAFVRELVAEVADMMAITTAIARVTGSAVSEPAGAALAVAELMVAATTVEDAISLAVQVHDVCHAVGDDQVDRPVEMLSACASAVRFGLETPCRSRHAADAAQQVWSVKYGITLSDDQSPGWGDQWARRLFRRALATSAIAAWNRRAPSAAQQAVKDCLTTQAAYRAGAAEMRERAAETAEAFPARNHGALATAPYAAAEQAAEEVATAIRALPLPAGGSGWRDMTDKPTRPMPVLYWFGKRWWHQADGTPATLDPVRDPAERTEAGWWNGEEWCETGTGHDLFEPWREERDLPTHWQPLPAAPEEGG